MLCVMTVHNLIITRKQLPWYLCTVKMVTVQPSEIMLTSYSTVQSYSPAEHNEYLLPSKPEACSKSVLSYV